MGRGQFPPGHSPYNSPAQHQQNPYNRFNSPGNHQQSPSRYPIHHRPNSGQSPAGFSTPQANRFVYILWLMVLVDIYLKGLFQKFGG